MYSVEHDGAGRNGMNEAGGIASRLASLSASLTSARESDRDRYRGFFATLGARIEVARAVECDLDLLLARNFNAFDYLRKDELGLSRIVADLLDPDGAHGQGGRFLARFGDMVGPDRWPTDPTARGSNFEVEVVRERLTDGGRYLDISIEFRAQGRDDACVAIENKPYAVDGKDQIADYLKFLRRHYPGRFLLIYLSGHGRGPASHALPDDACRDGLAVMPYCQPEAARAGEDAPGRRFSLTHWLRECRQACEAERVRWFLREAETFCHKTFGGAVTTTSEREQVRKFILADDDNVRTAIAVAEAWPETRDEVVGRFLEVLRDRIDEGLRSIGGLQVVSHSIGPSKQPGGVEVSKTTWSADGGAFVSVWLTNEGDAKDWSVSIYCAPDVQERLKERLRAALRGGDHNDNVGCPWYRFLKEHKDWALLVARLHEELQAPSELVDYFTCQFVEVAKLAIPIIDEVLADCR